MIAIATGMDGGTVRVAVVQREKTGAAEPAQ